MSSPSHRTRPQLLRNAAILAITAVSIPIVAEIVGYAQQQPPPGGQFTVQQLADCLAFGEARTARSARTGTVRFIGTDLGRPILHPRPQPGGSRESAALAYLSICGSLFGLDNAANELAVRRSAAIGDSRHVVRFQQRHQGVPVLGGEMVVHLDGANNILAVSGETLPSAALSVVPSIAPAAAAGTALDIVAATYGISRQALSPTQPELWVYAPSLIGPRFGRSLLVWRVDVIHNGVPPVRELVLVDAQQGEVALNFNQIHGARNRLTYTAGNTQTLPGTLVCAEANPTCAGGDADASAAHVYAGDTYDYYFSNFGRDSLNNTGMTLTSTVHWGPVGYQNAFWNGAQMAYGDGFSQADDVVGHELTHGVTEFESNLFYYYQSGAINESLSDVFGEIVDLTNGRGNDGPAVRWLLGEDIPPSGLIIRNMANPPAYGDPDRITSPLYYTGTADGGGVHTNSGVNNKAAVLMVDGGTFNGQTVTALGLAKTGRIYYEVATNFLVSGSDYADLHEMIFQACTNLIGTAGIVAADCQQVRNATLAVEMHLQPVAGYNPDAPLCGPGQLPVNTFFDSLETGLGNFTTSATVGTVRWTRDQGYAHSGQFMLYGNDFAAGPSDSSIALTNGVVLPAGAFLHFAHAFALQTPDRDGGVLEYSTDGGTTWTDAGSLIDSGGYRGSIATGFSNPLAGRAGFIGRSNGYVSSRLNLASLAGQTVRFRWRLGLDPSGFGDFGWVVDDVRIYRCSGAAVTTVAPGTAAQGRANLNVAVTGQETHFAQGSTAASFGAGIVVNSVTVTDATHATVNISIASSAALGGRNVSMTTGGEVAVGFNLFTVTAGPQLTLTPNRGQPGQSRLAVSISATGTNFVQGQTTATFGAGITTVTTTVADTTHAVVVIDIAAGAALGLRDVTLTTGSEAATATGGFLVRSLPTDTTVYSYVVGRRLSPSQGGTTGLQTLNVINTVTNAIVAAIPVGNGCSCVGPDGVAVHPDGTRVYVTNEMDNSLSVVDAMTNAVIATVPVGTGPTAVTVHPNGNRVYVVNGSGTTSVSVIDALTNSVVATIPLNVVAARGIAIHPDGSRVYVTTYNTGTVKVINTTTNSVVANIATGNWGLGLDVSPNGAKLYVATFPTNNSGGIPWVSVIDTATNALQGNIGGMPQFPSDVGVTPDGGRAYVIAATSSPIVNLATNAIIGNLPAPATGSSVEFTPDGSRAHVATYTNVTVVNAQANSIIGTIVFNESLNGRAGSVAMGPGPIRRLSLSGNLSFGNRWVGSTGFASLVISNSGNAPLTVNAISYPPGFAGNWPGGSIPARGSQVVTVTFTPTNTVTYGGSITVHSDQSGGSNTIAVSGRGITFPRAAADFDDDGRADIGIYRQSNGLWAVIRSAGGSTVVGWGDPGSQDMPVAADYDGDGRADIAVYRRTTGEWFIIRSTNSTLLSVGWGAPSLGDIPVPADYDGDGRADIAVYRQSTGQWFIIRSSNNTLLQPNWGAPALGDVPVPADYDGDGRADIAVHRLSTGEWFIIRSTNSTLLQVAWGAPALGDIPVVGDYDGDGRADVAVYRLSSGGWFVIRSSNSTLLTTTWGSPELGDVPVPGDYDGDGRTDVAVYRKTTGDWYIIRSTNSTLLHVSWGAPALGDSPPQYQ